MNTLLVTKDGWSKMIVWDKTKCGPIIRIPYRLLPFVMMPKLSATETEKFKEAVFQFDEFICADVAKYVEV